MKWLLPAALAGGIILAAIVPAWRDRAEVVGRVTVTSCAEDLEADVADNPSLSWRLRVADDSDGIPLDVPDEQLIALGFDRHAVSQLGQPSTNGSEFPRPRPAWLKLATDSVHGGRLMVEAVGATRASVGPDPNAILVRALVGLDLWGLTPLTPGDSGTTRPRQRRLATMHVDAQELIPALLHLTAAQHAALRAVRAGRECRTSRARLVIAMGRGGSLWVEKLLTD